MSPQTSLITHRVRFMFYEPLSINCIARNSKTSKIALLRRPIRKYKPSQNDLPSVIEIWNFRNRALFLEQTIYEDTDQSNLLESIAWTSSGRLFSCGLNSYLNEYDLMNGRILKSYCTNSDPAWCLSIDQDDEFIAVGTEKGLICIFKIFHDCLQYEKALPKNEKRIMCLEWFRPENDYHNLFLVAGSIDYIKIYNYQQERCVDFIKVGNNNVVVWCLKVLKDFTIVSGDSNGNTSFWNGKTVTLIRSYNSHRGDVLTLDCSADEMFVFSAGVDPTIVQFNRRFDDSWFISFKRHPHSHDIRSLIVEKDWLISGGVDSFLTLNSYKEKCYVSHLTNLYHKVSLTCNDQHSYMALMYEKFIQIWKLGIADGDRPSSTGIDYSNPSIIITPLHILDNAVKLMDIKSRKSLIAFDFNTEWLVYANYDNLKVINWTESKIEKIKFLHDPISNITNIRMIHSNRFVVSHGKNFDIFKLDKFGVLMEHSACSERGRIHRIECSTSKLFVVTADRSNTVSIYDLENEYSLLASFPNPLMPTAIRINQYDMSERLWLAYANSLLVEYDIDSLYQCNTYMITKFKSTNENFESKTFNEQWPIKQLAFSKNSLLIANDNHMFNLNLDKKTITKCEKYHHVLFMSNMPNTNNEELVVVELKPHLIMQTLPPMLKTRTFGT